MNSFLINLSMILILWGSAVAQQSNLRFEHISIEDGLSQITVNSILQDSKGFIWFGTTDGLNKYDGYNFTVFRNDPDNPNSLSNNLVYSIYEDRSGTLWIGTEGGGLNKFDREKEQFSHYINDPNNPKSLSNDIVRSIYEDNSGILWIGTDGGGVNNFDREKEQFNHYRHDPNNPKSLSNDIVWTIYEDRSGALWIGTIGGGLNKFDREKEQFNHYKHDSGNLKSLSHDIVRSIYEDRSGILWIGTEGGGLNQFDREMEQFNHYKHDSGNPKSLSHDIVRSIYEDRSGILWIGTEGGGLNKFDREKEQFNHYKHDSGNPKSLSHDLVLSIYEDRSGVLWIGTWGGGVNKFDREKEQFSHYTHDSNNLNSLSNPFVLSIYEDRSGILWIGTWDGGLNQIDLEKEQFTHYKYDPNNPYSIGDNYVRSIHEDRSGTLWIGTWGGGLNRFNRKSEQFTHFKYDPDNPNSLSDNYVRSIYEDRSGTLWIGTESGGLNRFDRKREHFTHYKYDPDNPNSLSDNYVRSIYEDRSGTLWVGTKDGGLNRFDRESEQFTHYKHDLNNPRSLSHNYVSLIYEDRSGTLWIGTYGGGLNRFDRETEQFLNYREKEGLPNDVIYGLLEDSHNNIWLSTNKGLSKFNPATEEFRNYNVNDGLQSDEFNGGAYFQSEDGRLFFGGVNGFNIFHPDSLRDNVYIPPVVITDFQILNKTVALQSNERDKDIFTLPAHISETNEILMSYKESVFSFEFAALSYSAPENNKYAYMMEGFDTDWVYTDATRRFATYTNLDAGEYTFKVKASNSDGIWNEEGYEIKIIITPPYWLTWWFRTLSIIIFVALVITAHRLRTKNIETRNKSLRIEIDERKRAEEALIISEQKFRNLVENSPVGIAISTPEGVVVDANPPMVKMFGYKSKEEFLKNPVTTYYDDDLERERLNNMLEKGNVKDFETKFRRKDGSVFWGSLTSVRQVLDDNSVQYLHVFEDVTERKRAEEALTDSEKKYRLLVNNIPDSPWITDQEGKTTYISPNIEKIYGFTPDEIYKGGSKLWLKRIHPDDIDMVINMFESLFKSNNSFDVEYRIKHKNGKWIWLHDRAISLVAGKDQISAYGILSDITDRKKAEKEIQKHEKTLRTLSTSLIHAGEAEKKRLSRELHDEMGQSLTAVKFNLDEIKDKLPSNFQDSLSEPLNEMFDIINKLDQNVHEIALKLRPTMLDEFGLVSAIRWYTDRFEKRSKISVKFEVKNFDIRLSGDLEIALFRILQEALTNITRHAKATKVTIKLEMIDGEVRFKIKDNGKGFDTAEIFRKDVAKGRLGLLGMKERITQEGGHWSFKSAEGKGSVIDIHISTAT